MVVEWKQSFPSEFVASCPNTLATEANQPDPEYHRQPKLAKLYFYNWAFYNTAANEIA